MSTSIVDTDAIAQVFYKNVICETMLWCISPLRLMLKKNKTLQLIIVYRVSAIDLDHRPYTTTTIVYIET